MKKVILTKKQILMVINAMKSGEIKVPIYMSGATFNAVFNTKSNKMLCPPQADHNTVY